MNTATVTKFLVLVFTVGALGCSEDSDSSSNAKPIIDPVNQIKTIELSELTPDDGLDSIQALPIEASSVSSPFDDTVSLNKMIEEITLLARSKDLKGINKYIHPDLGCYFVYRTGVNFDMEQIHEFKQNWGVLGFSISDIYWMLDLKEAKFEEWPEYSDCGYEGFSKNGNYLKEAKNYEHLSGVHNHNSEANDSPFLNKSELIRAQKVETAVKYSLISTENSVIIQFILVDGKWYLGVLNKGKFDCSG